AGGRGLDRLDRRGEVGRRSGGRGFVAAEVEQGPAGGRGLDRLDRRGGVGRRSGGRGFVAAEVEQRSAGRRGLGRVDRRRGWLDRRGGVGDRGRGLGRLGLGAGLLARRRAGGWLAPDRGEQHLGDVEHLDVLACLSGRLLGGQTVGEHHPAERAADRDLV